MVVQKIDTFHFFVFAFFPELSVLSSAFSSGQNQVQHHSSIKQRQTDLPFCSLPLRRGALLAFAFAFSLTLRG